MTKFFVTAVRKGCYPNDLLEHASLLANHPWSDVPLVTETPCLIEWLDDPGYPGLRLITVDLYEAQHTAIAIAHNGCVECIRLYGKDERRAPTGEVEEALSELYLALIEHALPQPRR